MLTDKLPQELDASGHICHPLVASVPFHGQPAVVVDFLEHVKKLQPIDITIT
jgi:hypothetical protein